MSIDSEPKSRETVLNVTVNLNIILTESRQVIVTF